MNWLQRLWWRPQLRPMSIVQIIERWVCLVVIVEQRPWRPISHERGNSKGNRPPKRLKGNRHRRRSRNRQPRYNPPY